MNSILKTASCLTATGAALLLAANAYARQDKLPERMLVRQELAILDSGAVTRDGMQTPATTSDRLAAIAHLATFGRNGRPALPTLVKLLDDDFGPIRFAAAAAVLQIEPSAFSARAEKVFADAGRTGESIDRASLVNLAELEPLPLPAERLMIAILSRAPARTDSESSEQDELHATISAEGLAHVATSRRRHVAEVLAAAVQRGTLRVRTSAAVSLREIDADRTKLVKSLRAQLESAEGGDRSATALALMGLGVSDPDLIAAVQPLCGSGQARTCSTVMRVIGLLDPMPQSALPMLHAAVLGGDSTIVEPAAEALLNFGDTSDTTLRVWVRALAGEASDVAKSALTAMRSKATAGLIEGLHDSEAEIRRECAAFLSTLTPAEGREAVPQLTEMLSDSDASVRGRAAMTLGSFASDSQSAVPRLLSRLTEESDDDALDAVVHAIAYFHSEASAAQPALAALIRNNPVVRTAAAETLSILGGDPTAALTEVLKSSSADERVDALLTMMEHDKTTPAAVDALRAALRDNEPRVRSTAAFALARVSVELSAEMIDVLSTALRQSDDRNSLARSNAAEALAHYGDRALPILTAALADPDSRVRQAVAAALNGQNLSAGAIDALLAAARDPSDAVRVNVMSTLGPYASSAAVQLVLAAAADDESAEVRWASVEALTSRAPDAPAARAVMIRSIADPVDWVRREALLRLASHDLDAAAQHVDAYIDWLAGQDYPSRGLTEDSLQEEGDARAKMAVVIGTLGSRAKQAIPVLQDWSTSDPGIIRGSVRVALARIEPQRLPALVTSSIASLQATDAALRMEAVYVLESIGPAAARALPALQRLQREEEEWWLLGRIGSAISQIRKDEKR